jgi:hypothetical protein
MCKIWQKCPKMAKRFATILGNALKINTHMYVVTFVHSECEFSILDIFGPDLAAWQQKKMTTMQSKTMLRLISLRCTRAEPNLWNEQEAGS